jgi:uncharacterized damage-inducible protein DinB
MQADDLRAVMIRDLRDLAREVQAYPDDASLWQPVPGIANTGGTLVLHLAGNIQHFIGAVLGGSAYVRDREAEFGRRGVTRAELVAEIERAVAAAERVMPTLTSATLAAAFPVPMGGRTFTTARWLTHLLSHLAYHLGQVDYHRRMVAPASGTAGTMGLAAL